MWRTGCWRRTQPESFSRYGPRRPELESLEGRMLLSFLPAVDYSVGSSPGVVVAGAFVTGRGVLDLAVSDAPEGTVSVLRGNGDGTFGARVKYPVGRSPQGL